MKTFTRISAFALVAAAITFFVSRPADAQVRVQLGGSGVALAFGPGGGGGGGGYGHQHHQSHAPSLPKLGFWSHVDYGDGLHITRVRYGSPAWQLGLREGDTIMSVNEFSLAYGGWNNALRDALNHHDGYIELCVRKAYGGIEHVTWHFHWDGHGHEEYRMQAGG